jgi:integrase
VPLSSGILRLRQAAESQAEQALPCIYGVCRTTRSGPQRIIEARRPRTRRRRLDLASLDGRADVRDRVGRRWPGAIGAVLEEHLQKHVAPSPDALLFSTSSGGYLARSNWNSTFRRAVDAIGLPALRPHELRHTGATLAAATSATTKELMRRLGHSSPAAALLYQHAAEDRDAEIARALDAMLSGLAEPSDDDVDERPE